MRVRIELLWLGVCANFMLMLLISFGNVSQRIVVNKMMITQFELDLGFYIFFVDLKF